MKQAHHFQSPSHKISLSNDEKIFNLRNPLKLAEKDKKDIDYIKILKSIKLQEDLRKLRNFKQIQKSMKKEKNQISEIEQELQKVEQKIVQKKKQIIQKHIQQIDQKKHERQSFIQQTNKELQLVKRKNDEKKKQIEMLIKQFEQKQQHTYQKTIKQRVNRYRNPINFEDINNHQKKYLELKTSFELKASKIDQSYLVKKGSVRVKSQISAPHYQNQFQNLSIDNKSRLDQRIRDQYREAKLKQQVKMQHVVKMINKRNEYGNRVQNERKNIRVKTEHHSQTKRQQESRLFWQSIRKQNEAKLHAKKPKLNTNLPKIDIKDYTKMSLQKIVQNNLISPIQKLEKLRVIQNLYLNKSNTQAAQIISQISLMKANLLLNI